MHAEEHDRETHDRETHDREVKDVRADPVRRADVDDDEESPPEMPDAEEGRARARARSGDPSASEIGTAATAERWERLRETGERERVQDMPADGWHNDLHLAGPVPSEGDYVGDRDDDPSTLPLNDPEVRSTYERHARGEDMDGERRNNQPPGW